MKEYLMKLFIEFIFISFYFYFTTFQFCRNHKKWKKNKLCYSNNIFWKIIHKCPSKQSKYGSKKIYITRHNTKFSGELFIEPSVLFFLLMQKKIETQPSFFSVQIQQKFNKNFSGKNINFKKITKNVFYKTLKT